jgi:hypothetical protein
MSFEAATDTALKVGARWDASVASLAEQKAAKSARPTKGELSRLRFDIIDRIIAGREQLSIAAASEDFCTVGAPARPFWFRSVATADPIRIETARDAVIALEALNLNSWSPGNLRPTGRSFRGWLISPLHAMARMCRWSISNYLLATPSSVAMFIHDVAALSRISCRAVEPEAQNRLRLSRMKVTGP